MGNILSLSRNGWQNASTFTNMDNMVYDYNAGNQLQKVTDSGNANYGFKDGANQAIEYTYDTDGNLLTDVNKGITSILYNHLNMPTEIKFNNSNTQKINYTYSADGVKVRKVVNDNGSITTTDYTGGYQYVNNDLEFIKNIEDGYVYPKNGGGFGYMYYYTDQLDNIRLMYSDADGNGSIDPASEIIKEAHFYPFGLKLEGFNATVQSTGSSNYKYDFQNQERQDELGLNWLQFKYRMQDPTIGRFISIDPLSDSYVHNSTYAFAENKVIKFNELEGLEITLNKFDKLSRENRQGFTGHAVFVANAGISLANSFIDVFNYAGDLDRADQSGQGSFNKLRGDTKSVINGIDNYLSTTNASKLQSDVANLAKDPNTAEDLAGGFLGGGLSRIKLGSINRSPSNLSKLQSKFDNLAETKLLPEFKALDPNLKSGVTGSFKTGKVGNPLKKTFGQSIDLNDFDIDFFIESDVLFKEFGKNLKANPLFRDVLKNTKGFEGLRPNKKGFSIKFKPFE